VSGTAEPESARWHVYDLPAGLDLALEDLTPDGYVDTIDEIALPVGQPPTSGDLDERMHQRRLLLAVDAAGRVARHRQLAWSADSIERARFIVDGYDGFSYVFNLRDGRTVIVASTPQLTLTGGDGRWPGQYPGVEHWLCGLSPSDPEVSRVHVNEPE
jgi:hypothetical protein